MSNQAHNVIVTGPAQKKTPCIHQSSSSTCPTSMSSCDLVRTQNLSQVKRLLRRQAPFSGPISIKLCEISAYFSFPIETWRKNRSGFVVWVAEVLGCWKSEQVLAVATGSGCSPAASPISLSTTPSGHRSASTITATSTTRRRLLPRGSPSPPSAKPPTSTSSTTGGGPTSAWAAAPSTRRSLPRLCPSPTALWTRTWVLSMGSLLDF